jgi:hypothetical protein
MPTDFFALGYGQHRAATSSLAMTSKQKRCPKGQRLAHRMSKCGFTFADASRQRYGISRGTAWWLRSTAF